MEKLKFETAPNLRDQALPKSPEWRKSLAVYQHPSPAKSLWQIANTLVPYVVLWVYLATHLSKPLWQTIPLIFIASGFLLRSFIIFHDCVHMSFFKSRRANEIVGMLTGLLTFTPYYTWRWEHTRHHQTVGNLDNRGVGDVWTLTRKEYLESSTFRRILYRLIRSPYFLFGFAPIFLFIVLQRIPSSKNRPFEKRAAHVTTAALLAAAMGLSSIFGWREYLIVQMSILALAATYGVWFFYLQHQYEDTYWERDGEWDFFEASMAGSSFYKLPKILQFFSASIGFHHVHHLNSRIPNYNLELCHDNLEFLRDVKTIRFFEGFKAARLALWDDEQKRLVTFKESKAVTSKSIDDASLNVGM